MDRETQMQLIEMGIASPVTKDTAGEVRAHVLTSCPWHKDQPMIRSQVQDMQWSCRGSWPTSWKSHCSRVEGS